MATPFTEQLTQCLAWPIGDLPPLNRASNTATNSSGWIVGPIDMSRFRRVMGRASTGVIVGASCTCVLTFLYGSAGNAQSLGNVSDTGNWAQITSGPSVTLNANTAGTIEIRADQMPANSRYLALLVNNNSAALFQAEVLGAATHYSPASQYNANTTFLLQAVSNL